MVITYNGLAELNRKLSASANVKNTKFAMIIRDNMAVVNGEIEKINVAIETQQTLLLDKYKENSSDIEAMNAQLEKIHAGMADNQGRVNVSAYESAVDAVLEQHPSVKPFYMENKKMIDDFMSAENIIEDMKTINIEDLPDNLSANDIAVLAFLIDGL